ncbi:MAG TPA: vWA domain-containing protein, partial [Acidimicrobiia bacterium]|nr:vWA domain-containing protein [Acidimicrobiia bacterium]
LPLGREVAAYLDGEDLVAFDNQRFVAAPLPGSLKVRLHGESAFFIEQILEAIPDVDAGVAPGEDVDFEIYSGVAVPLAPTEPFIAIDSPGGAPGITPAGRVEDPIPTLVTDDPLLEDVDVSRIAIADAQVVEVEGGEVLLAAPGAPLIVRGETNGVDYFYIAFTLEQSNLPGNVAFPIIASRMVGELASTDGAATSLTVGDRVPVGSLGGAVVDPRGNRQTVPVGESAPATDQAGFWVVESTEQEPVVIAVNADTDESHLAPRTSLPGLRPAPEGAGDEGTNTAQVARSLLLWVVGALLVVLGVEYWVSRRTRGVSDRQWRWGTALRIFIVGLLVLSVIDPDFSRSDNSVTTVFVVDVSDSIGDSVSESRSWVEAAITDAGDGRWAVVEVGGDARVATPRGNLPYSGAADVDVTATNLARGLRLGESLLTGETRERLVLVSDGRSNTGDLSAEIDRLKALGVVVDVHTVEAAVGTDAAVATIDVPSEVNAGESFEAVVEILSTVSASGEVELLANGEVVGRQSASLEPGSNLVTFPVDAGEPGLQDLTARVQVSGDSTRQNDSTTTGVQVQGPASVLVIEGEEGEGQIIVDVLGSKGLVVETITMEELPGIQELS